MSRKRTTIYLDEDLFRVLRNLSTASDRTIVIRGLTPRAPS
jgi:hypothetical protein